MKYSYGAEDIQTIMISKMPNNLNRDMLLAVVQIIYKETINRINSPI